LVAVLSAPDCNPALIVASCAIFLVQAYFLMMIFYPRAKRPNLLVLVMVLLLWFMPLMADVCYYAVRDKAAKLDVFSVYSPLGTITQALESPVNSTGIGVLGQGLICASIGVVLFALRRRRRQVQAQPESVSTL
jgi:hypothetical protein